ncbi:unnamed protein product [Urochloa humidicola]
MPPPLPPTWSDLPLELAGLVFGRLPAHADRVRAAAVCRQWRAAVREVPLPPPMPLLAVPDGTAYSLPLHKRLHFPACDGYAAAASGNWLLFISPCTGNYGYCFLQDPFSGATMPLPALSRVWWRHHKRSDGSIVDRRCASSETSLAVRRLLLCSPDLVAAQVVLRRKPRIAVCKPGTASWWSVFTDDDDPAPVLGAMVFHQYKLFAVGKSSGHLYAIDVSVDASTGDPWVSRVRQVIDTIVPLPSTIIPEGSAIIVETKFYLVESRGTLLMVRSRRMEKQWAQLVGEYELEVFEADLQGCSWTQVATVGDDRVLFLSGHHCRSLCVSHLGMPGDRVVVFGKDVKEDHGWFGKESTCSCIVYNIRDRKLDDTLLQKAFRWKRDTVRATWLFPEESSIGESP